MHAVRARGVTLMGVVVSAGGLCAAVVSVVPPGTAAAVVWVSLTDWGCGRSCRAHAVVTTTAAGNVHFAIRELIVPS